MKVIVVKSLVKLEDMVENEIKNNCLQIEKFVI